jgi:predicted transcriptional regulator YdeE
MKFKREKHAAFDVVGTSVRASNTNAAETIGPLWGRFYGEGTADKIQGRLDNCMLGVYSKYESDHNGEYTLMAGCRVKDDAPTPEGLERIRVPAQEYVIITGKGEMPQVVWETWGKVYETDIPRAFTTDFEVYNPDKPNELEIWLAAK